MPRGPLLHQRLAKALDIWLAVYYAFIIGYKCINGEPAAVLVACVPVLPLTGSLCLLQCQRPLV